MIKISVTEEAIFAGIPINVRLLFSREHYFGAAESFLRGIERRIDAGLNPDVASLASVFISRWDSVVDSVVAGTVPTRCAISSVLPSEGAPAKGTEQQRLRVHRRLPRMGA